MNESTAKMHTTDNGSQRHIKDAQLIQNQKIISGIEIPESVQALLFDCDGTLIDSMPLHLQAWEQVIKAVGGKYDYDFFFSRKGMRETDIVRLYNQHYGTSFDPEKIVAHKHEFVLSHLDTLKPINFVVDIVFRYRSILPMAVVSGGRRDIVQKELELIGILDAFDVVITGDDPLKPKPEPDMFIEAAKKLGVVPQYCLVFEDGDYGLEAAKKAAMMAIDIRLFVEQ